MKILCIHAHFDDFEFLCAGIFALFKKKYKDDLKARVLICTDGKAGHHFRTREETGRIRKKEQEKSAAIGGYEVENLRLPNGEVPREGYLQCNMEFLAALWNSIRLFEPNYIFCPPIVTDPLVGIHIDHVTVAEGVRKVGYLINVPHFFTPEFPANETESKLIKVPVILNLLDNYQNKTFEYDFVLDITEVFDLKAQMTFCHESQIKEWLPWVSANKVKPPKDIDDWGEILKHKHFSLSRHINIYPETLVEAINVTAWGAVPSYDQLITEFPPLLARASNLDSLRERLLKWNS